MRKLLFVIPLVLLICFSFGYQRKEKLDEQSSVDVQADVEAIKKLSDEYGAMVTAGDTEGFLNLFTNDAVLMPPNNQMLVGKEEIRPLVQGILKDAKEIELTEITTPSEIKAVGNWVFDLGITTFKARGKPLEDTNKYIRIWQKMADGSWKLARVIFNSNNPLPPKEE
jgi:uncharacterized protein (TIGR02246 family)